MDKFNYKKKGKRTEEIKFNSIQLVQMKHANDPFFSCVCSKKENRGRVGTNRGDKKGKAEKAGNTIF